MNTAIDPQPGEVVQPCSPERARDLTDKIRTSLGVAWELVKQAYQERAWSALGYPSWDSYVAQEFGTNRLRLPREERADVVASLRDAGMSIRAIAAATGTGRDTVQRELSAVRNRTPAEVDADPTPPPEPITGTDGKTYPAKPAKTPAKPQRRPLTDSFFDAMFDLTKQVERIERLADDDRFPRNAEQVAAKHRNDLISAVETLSKVLDQLPTN